VGKTPPEQASHLRPHLHLHLETSQRLRRMWGRPTAKPSERTSFYLLSGEQELPPNSELEILLSLIRAVHAEQVSQGVTYAELRIPVRRCLQAKMSLRYLIKRISDATRQLDPPVLWLVLLLERRDSPRMLGDVQAEVEAGLPAAWVGVDLAGDEIEYPDDSAFARLLQKARATGLGVTVHAGEFGGERGVWRAVDELGALRIGHGLAASGSASLLSRLARDGIMIELCLTSNLRLGVVPSIHTHPLPIFVAAGVPTSFSTDMPVRWNIDLDNEERLAGRMLSCDMQDIQRIQRRAEDFIFRPACPHNEAPPGDATSAPTNPSFSTISKNACNFVL
jgi:adenosine deaminase